MKIRDLFLISGVILCLAAIAVILTKGSPRDMVTLDSVSEIGEGIIHSVNKLGRIATAVTDKEEMELGNKLHEGYHGKKADEFLKDTPLAVYVQDVGNRMAQNVKRKDIKYTFHITRDLLPNAFSMPGGHIYVNMGLLLVLRSESELASVLGHEIVHVDAKHCIGMFQYRIKSEKILGTGSDGIMDAGYMIFIRPGYSEVQENEADAGSTYLLYKAGYHPMAMAYAFRRIDEDAMKKDHNNYAVTPVGDTLGAIGGAVIRYFGSHPAAIQRIDKITKYVTDNKLVDGKKRYYVGERNYDETISYTKKGYKEELKAEYSVTEPKEEPGQKQETVMPTELKKVMTEVYTPSGRIALGMTLDELDKVLPLKDSVFKRDTRIGYKHVSVYEFKNKLNLKTISLWIDVSDNKVTGIRIIK